IVHVDLPIQVGIAAVGVHDERIRARHRLPRPYGGRGTAEGNALRFRTRSDADAVEIARGRDGLGSQDAGAAVPTPGATACLNQSGDPVVDPRGGCTDADLRDQLVVADVDLARGGGDAGCLEHARTVAGDLERRSASD